MKGFLLLSLIIFESIFLCAQHSNVDSLKKLLQEAKVDTTRVLLLYQLSANLQRSKPDSAFALAQQGLQLAKQINYLKGELYSKVSIGRCFWSIGDYTAAIRLVLPEEKKVEKSNDLLLQTDTYAALQDSYRDMGDYSEALKYAFKSTTIMERIEHCPYCKIQTAAIASIYLGKGALDSAKFYLQKALSYPPSYGFDGWIYSIAGQIYDKMKKYDSAFSFYRLSIQTLIDVNNLKDLAGTYNNITSLFITTSRKDSALLYARKSLALSQQKRFAKEILETSLLLSKVFEKVDIDSSLYYYKQAMSAKDILYDQEKQKQILSYKFNDKLQQQEIESSRKEYRNQIKIYSLMAIVIIILVVAFLLYRNNNNKQKAYVLLQNQKKETDKQKIKAEQALEELKSTQAQLIQSEKMASLGELTAGIAHEIQNPLNFVNNFSEVNTEMIAEMKDEIDKGNVDEAKAIANDIADNQQKINHHGRRADAIVKGMLQHSRVSSGEKEPTDINALADEYLRLSYHGVRAKDNSFNATLQTDFDRSIDKINIIPQDIGRVVLNLFTNAFYSVTEKKRRTPQPPPIGGGTEYEPTVSVSTKLLNTPPTGGGLGVEIRVRDNGMGIPQKLIDKIFQPFFTTKPTGQGTGLGLSLSYDIIKAHGGEIKVETNEGEGAEFIIQLPIIHN